MSAEDVELTTLAPDAACQRAYAESANIIAKLVDEFILDLHGELATERDCEDMRAARGYEGSQPDACELRMKVRIHARKGFQESLLRRRGPGASTYALAIASMGTGASAKRR